MLKGIFMIYFNEKANLKEMAVMSSRTDTDLEDIDIAVFSKEHPPKHAAILKRGNHEIQLGCFKITPNLPKSHFDIKEIKEEIDAKYKRQIAAWAGKDNAHIKGYTNWGALDVIWNILNPKY
jgi:hypothetical protein